MTLRKNLTTYCVERVALRYGTVHDGGMTTQGTIDPGGMDNYTVRMPDELHDRILDAADIEQRTFSQIMRIAAAAWLDKHHPAIAQKERAS